MNENAEKSSSALVLILIAKVKCRAVVATEGQSC